MKSRLSRAPKLPVATEEQEAFWLASWLTLNDVFFIHIPNEGKRSPRAGARLKRMGLLPGASDFFILDSPPALPLLKGVWVELKRHGGKPTDEQLQFLTHADHRGYGAFWIAGGEAAAEKLKTVYGYGRRLG